MRQAAPRHCNGEWRPPCTCTPLCIHTVTPPPPHGAARQAQTSCARLPVRHPRRRRPRAYHLASSSSSAALEGHAARSVVSDSRVYPRTLPRLALTTATILPSDHPQNCVTVDPVTFSCGRTHTAAKVTPRPCQHHSHPRRPSTPSLHPHPSPSDSIRQVVSTTKTTIHGGRKHVLSAPGHESLLSLCASQAHASVPILAPPGPRIDHNSPPRPPQPLLYDAPPSSSPARYILVRK